MRSRPHMMAMIAGALAVQAQAVTEAANPKPVQRWCGTRKVGRNEPCPCDSGKKFKKCCGFSGNSSEGIST